MRTRIQDIQHPLGQEAAPSVGYSFQYTGVRYPNVLPHQWLNVGAWWSSPARRDQARRCFTRRKSLAAAMEDLRRLNLFPGDTR